MKKPYDPIPEGLLDLLVCPVCKVSLEYDKGRNELICPKCKKKYPIKEGIPLLMSKLGKK